MAWGSARSPTTTDPLPAHDVTGPVEHPIEFIRRCILEGPITNARCPPPTRQLSPKLSAFSYIADMYSLYAYRFPREHFALRSENTLRTK
jgi:hypothetical protein